LKNHSGIAFVRRHPALVLVVKEDSAFVGSVKSRDHTERRGFAASDGPKRKNSPPPIQRKMVDRLDWPRILVTESNLRQRHGVSGSPPFFPTMHRRPERKAKLSG
jgi:hypothetical protein